jgi:hypothetical protein
MPMYVSPRLGHRGVRGDVDHDVLGEYACLELPCLGVLPATAEETRRLHAEIPNLRGNGAGEGGGRGISMLLASFSGYVSTHNPHNIQRMHVHN